MMRKGDQRAWESTIHEQGAGILGNPKRRTMKEGGWETFNLVERNQLTWKKWQKGKKPKGGSEKVESRTGKSARGLLKKEPQKKKIMRNKEGTVEGQNFTRKPIPWKVKKTQFKQQEESTLRPYLYSDFQQKRPLKNPTKSNKRTGPGYPEAARGPGSSGNAAQLMWD